MSFEADLRTHLGAAAVTALVEDRIHPIKRPDAGALPAVTYQMIALDQVNNLAGRDGSLRNYRVQIDIWAADGKFTDHLLAIDAAIRARMDTPATTFRSAMLPSGFDDFEPDVKIYRRMLEYSCWYTEA